MPVLVSLTPVAQSCVSDFTGAAPSSPIGMAAVRHKIPLLQIVPPAVPAPH